MTISKPAKHHLFWTALGLSALISRGLLSEEFIESYYSRGLYLWIRSFFDFFGGMVQFSLFYLVIPVLVSIIFIQWIQIARQENPVRIRITNWFFNLLAWIGGLLFFFMLLWGFNYGRIPTEKQLGFENREINLEDLKKWVRKDAVTLSKMRVRVQPAHPEALDLIPVIRKDLQKVLSKNGYPASSEVKCYPIRPDGILLRFSTSGIYIPFDGQGHIDNGLHPIQKPFVTAHEMAHAYGFTGEGICNFWAYISCIQSPEPFIRYSGAMGFWRYMASAWNFADPEGYQLFRDSLPPVLVKDLDDINAKNSRYPDFMPAFRDAVYDSFLKAQGMEDGLANYDKIIPMVITWREKQEKKD